MGAKGMYAKQSPSFAENACEVRDTVKVIAGNEKGKIGEIIRLFKHNSTVIVKDMNIKTKHVKSKEQGEPGQIVKVEGPIHSSNVMLYSKEKEVHSRVGHKKLEDGSEGTLPN